MVPLIYIILQIQQSYKAQIYPQLLHFESYERIRSLQCRLQSRPKQPPRPPALYPTDTLEPCTES